MAETTRNEGAEIGADLVATARDRGMEQLEGAKGQLAEGAERVASAVDRTADALEEDGDNAISGFGHSVASLMRQLAGGLRERDIDDFARELADLARRNPGVFLAGSVALGFGIARFFKARVPQSSSTYRGRSWESTGGSHDSQDSTHGRPVYDSEEDLDLSASSAQRRDAQNDVSQGSSGSQGASASRNDERNDRNASKSRQSSKHKTKPQRASSSGSQHQSPSTESSSTDPAPTGATTTASDSAFTGGTGGGALRGGKS